MGSKTGIEWTDHTFNPWIGCTKVSPECKNCYAKTTDDRHLLGPVSHWGPGAPRYRTSESNWSEPIRWAKQAKAAGIRAKVFCASQADVFDAEAPDGAQRDLFNLIHITSEWLDWQLLTKRPERIPEVMEAAYLWPEWFADQRCWLGVSTGTKKGAEERIPLLRKIPAAVRFLSCEPLLEDIGKISLRGSTSIEWVICGGESGLGARPMHPDWARSLRDQCAAAGVPFFFKQWGEWGPLDQNRGLGWNLGDPRTGYWAKDAPGLYEWHHMGVASHGEHMLMVGKKAAGALLDGVEHKAFPAVQPCQ